MSPCRSSSLPCRRGHRPRRLRERAARAVVVALSVASVVLAAPMAQASTCSLGTIPGGSGTPGTSGNPYAIASAADLAEIRSCPRNAHYEQTANIDLGPGTSANHSPIGHSFATAFTGTYNGAGHAIEGLNISKSGYYTGLFGYVDRATITDLRLTDVAIVGGSYTGALVGYARTATRIVDVHVTGTVAGTMGVGGVVGQAGFGAASADAIEIRSVSASVDVTSSDSSGHSSSDVGGLIGMLMNGRIERSSATRDVSATSVVTDRPKNVGGLVGQLGSGGSISESFATGDVTVTGSSEQVGGLVGAARDAASALTNVSASGDVEGGDYVGGLIGHFGDGGIDNAIATGDVTASGPNVGGLGGSFGDPDIPGDPVIRASFWDVTAGHASDPAAAPGSVEPKATADLQAFATFSAASWPIVDGWEPYDPDPAANRTWGICEGASYPFLLWRYTSDPCSGGGGSSSAGPVSAASGGDSRAATAALAAERAVAVRVAGSASGVWVRDGVALPVTVGLSGAVGPRGGVVLESDGRQVRVASVLGARADAGVMVPTVGVFEASVSGGLVPGSVVEVWVRSTPRLVAAAEVPADGGPVTVAIPTGAPLDGGGPVEDGAHTLELRMLTTDGFEVVATGITVGQVVPTGVPAGEGGPVPPSRGAGLLVLLGVVAAAMRGLRGRSVSR